MSEKTSIVSAAVREARRPRAISLHHGVVAASLALTLGLGSVTAFGLSNGAYAGADEMPLPSTGATEERPFEGIVGADATQSRAEGAEDAPSLGLRAEGQGVASPEASTSESEAAAQEAEGPTADAPAPGEGPEAADASSAVDGEPEGQRPSDGADSKEPQASAAINLSASEGISSVLRSLDTAQELATLPVDKLLEEAMSHEGAPYVYGGTTPSGFDCSGFVLYCFRTALGMDLPRTAAAQSGLGEPVPMDSLERGDLLFWGSGGGVYHVGIYVGDGSYIHAAGDGQGVCVDTMTYFAPSFAKRLV